MIDPDRIALKPPGHSGQPFDLSLTDEGVRVDLAGRGTGIELARVKNQLKLLAFEEGRCQKHRTAHRFWPPGTAGSTPGARRHGHDPKARPDRHRLPPGSAPQSAPQFCRNILAKKGEPMTSRSSDRRRSSEPERAVPSNLMPPPASKRTTAIATDASLRCSLATGPSLKDCALTAVKSFHPLSSPLPNPPGPALSPGFRAC